MHLPFKHTLPNGQEAVVCTHWLYLQLCSRTSVSLTQKSPDTSFWSEQMPNVNISPPSSSVQVEAAECGTKPVCVPTNDNASNPTASTMAM